MVQPKIRSNTQLFKDMNSKIKFSPNSWMNRPISCITILSCLIFLLLVPICLAADSNESIDAAGRVTVTNVLLEPAVLMTGDVGLVTFTVENTGTSNVVISDAHLISKEITVLNSEIYSSSRTIGAGTQMDFTFTILANQPENVYYPAFYINYRDAGSLRYNVPIRVEEPRLSISAIGIPETFARGVPSQISLLLGNAKSVNITGITIEPFGEGVRFDRTSFFIGDIGPYKEKSVDFEIIPTINTNVGFNVSYKCGMNTHRTSFSIPVHLGTDKKSADPIINNIETSSESGGVRITGDVSNAGLSDAYGVIVSLDSASGDDGHPNQKYIIGTVSSGDFASFEIVVPQSVKPVPLMILYKDSSGNQLSKNVSIDLNQVSGGGSYSFAGGSGMTSGGPPGTTGGSSSGGRTTGGVNPMNPLSGMGSGMNNFPVMEIIYGISALVILIVLWLLYKRKMKGRKLRISFK